MPSAIKMGITNTCSFIDQDPAFGKYGCIEEMMEMKIKHRGVKTLLSIGGWTYTHFKTTLQDAAQTHKGRARFINSAVDLLKDLGFDGIDIDWEYPADDEEATNYVLLLKELREALDDYAEQSAPGYHFLMTIATPAGASDYCQLHLKEMDQYLDSWHLMGYDFSGRWESVAGHAANVYPSLANPAATPFSINNTLKDYISSGVPANKIVLGMPLYGRVFTNTTGVGKPHKTGIAEPPDYRIFPRPGAVENYDPQLVATWSFDSAIGEFVSYQGMEETHAKAKYIKEHGLGGSMWWQAGGDKAGNTSLVSNMLKDLGSLENSTNLLDYPESQYVFIRNAKLKAKKEKQPKKGKGKKKEPEMKDAGSALAATGHLLGIW